MLDDARPDAAKIRSYSKGQRSFVHHVVLGSTTKDEPEGIRECDAAFSITWRPLFAAGAGNVELSFPTGVVQSIEKDAQLVVQLHLLNTADHDVTDSAQIVMTTTDEADTQNVQFAVIGNTDVVLPSGQATTIVADCQSGATTRVVGYFPHMHMLGTSMTLESGPSADDMQTIYQRDPYEFNDQRIDSVDMALEGGQPVRLTCNYENTRPETVTYGESSLNEMCFLIMFVVGPPVGCIRRSAPLLGTTDSAGANGMGDGGTGTSTAGCPDVSIMGANLPGCCTEGMCGIDASQFSSGAGCVDLSAAASGSGQMGYMIDFPAPRACGGGS